jgi:hypothetical protein
MVDGVALVCPDYCCPRFDGFQVLRSADIAECPMVLSLLTAPMSLHVAAVVPMVLSLVMAPLPLPV